jgi:hypothetical protein
VGCLPTSFDAQTPALAIFEAERVVIRSTAGPCCGRFIEASCLNILMICGPATLAAGTPNPPDEQSLLNAEPAFDSPRAADQAMLKPIGIATLAMSPRVLQKLEGPRFPPIGADALREILRSTAGSCFGLFMVVYSL